MTDKVRDFLHLLVELNDLHTKKQAGKQSLKLSAVEATVVELIAALTPHNIQNSQIDLLRKTYAQLDEVCRFYERQASDNIRSSEQTIRYGLQPHGSAVSGLGTADTTDVKQRLSKLKFGIK